MDDLDGTDLADGTWWISYGRAPTGLRERIAGESKVNNLKNIWSNFRQTVALVKHL